MSIEEADWMQRLDLDPEQPDWDADVAAPPHHEAMVDDDAIALPDTPESGQLADVEDQAVDDAVPADHWDSVWPEDHQSAGAATPHPDQNGWPEQRHDLYDQAIDHAVPADQWDSVWPEDHQPHQEDHRSAAQAHPRTPGATAADPAEHPEPAFAHPHPIDQGQSAPHTQLGQPASPSMAAARPAAGPPQQHATPRPAPRAPAHPAGPPPRPPTPAASGLLQQLPPGYISPSPDWTSRPSTAVDLLLTLGSTAAIGMTLVVIWIATVVVGHITWP